MCNVFKTFKRGQQFHCPSKKLANPLSYLLRVSYRGCPHIAPALSRLCDQVFRFERTNVCFTKRATHFFNRRQAPFAQNLIIPIRNEKSIVTKLRNIRFVLTCCNHRTPFPSLNVKRRTGGIDSRVSKHFVHLHNKVWS